MTSIHRFKINKIRIKAIRDIFLLLEKVYSNVQNKQMLLLTTEEMASRIWQNLQISTVLYVIIVRTNDNKIITNCIKHIVCKCKVQKCRLF